MSYGSSDDEFRVLVVGKTGTGKSTLCNAILGQNKFTVGRGVRATTFTAQYGSTYRDGINIKVIDTPDITCWGFKEAKMREEVSKWRLYAKSPLAVVVTVRCDTRYTAQDWAVYRAILTLWEDDSIRDNLLVAFTFGDCLDKSVDKLLRKARPELRSVLEDAGLRYFVFNKNDEESVIEAAFTLMEVAQREKEEGGLPSSTGPLQQPCNICILLVVVICLLLVFIAYSPPFVGKNYFLHPSIDFGVIWVPVVIAALGVLMLFTIFCCRCPHKNGSRSQIL